MTHWMCIMTIDHDTISSAVMNSRYNKLEHAEVKLKTNKDGSKIVFFILELFHSKSIRYC
jgi:hypothetical protein